MTRRRQPERMVSIPARVLEGLLSRKWRSEKHLATCGIGQWVTGPDGGIVVRGCSERCTAIREVVG